ncbi:hypothetical protein HJG60_008489 [Phyllostomus discolor]|uniref:Uncharacterized protein n=1 Tax=Phyllostomus discolor TaxID=89673 RepID=A0A833Z560_9CHIR|nr:hypothetical protein HJG60_008489 [Phyllostomus discolor]
MLLNVRKWGHVHNELSWCPTLSSSEAMGRCQQARAPQRVHRNATALTNLRGQWRILRLGSGCMSSGDAVIRLKRRSWNLERILVALHGRHDQWLFLRDLDFRSLCFPIMNTTLSERQINLT